MDNIGLVKSLPGTDFTMVTAYTLGASAFIRGFDVLSWFYVTIGLSGQAGCRSTLTLASSYDPAYYKQKKFLDHFFPLMISLCIS